MDVLGRAFLERAGVEPSAALVRTFVTSYIAEWNRGVRYLDELPDLLARLRRRARLAIITNTHDPGLVPDHLARMGVADLFDGVFTSVELGPRKPAPEIFDHALRALGAERGACVYVGDTYEADYLGARRAGIRGLLIDRHGGAPIDARDRLDSIFALEERLGARGAGRRG